MPKKPSFTSKLPTLEEFGMPSSAQLQRAGAVSGAISKFIAVDEAVDQFHRKMIRNGMCSRVELALAVASDKNAFANFAKDKRIKALSRPPKDASDTLRCLFQATYADPKKASKYYKRVEPLWIKRCSAAEVLAFLEKHGVTKPPTKAPPAFRKTGPGKAAPAAATPNKTLKAAAGGEGDDDRVSEPAVNEGETPCGTFYFWPGKITVGRIYNLRVKILDNNGEAVNFDLHDLSQSPGR